MECAVCGVRKSVMKRCTRCKQVYYCSRTCQIDEWPTHKEKCQSVCVAMKSSVHQASFKYITITVTANHRKHKIVVPNSPKAAIDLIAKTLKIPTSKLKLIGQGKIVNEQDIVDLIFVKKCKAIMGFGEESEDEAGLNSLDIELVMAQLHIDRNKAVRGLKQCNGNVIDAILSIGNNL